MPKWDLTKHGWRWARGERARQQAADAAGLPPEVLHVAFDPQARTFTAFLDTEVDFVFPLAACPALAAAVVRAAAGAEVGPDGGAIAWPALGLVLALADLVAGRLDPIAAGAEGVAAASPPAVKTKAKAKAPRPAASAPPAPEPSAEPLAARPSPDLPAVALPAAPPVLVLHGLWVPDAGPAFERAGGFYLWAEHADAAAPSDQGRKRPAPAGVHPFQAPAEQLLAALEALVPIPPQTPKPGTQSLSLVLPAAGGRPVASPDLARWLEAPTPDAASPARFSVTAARLPDPLNALPALRFAALAAPTEVRLGADLLPWLHAFAAIKAAIVRDQYVPALALAQAPKAPKAPKGGKLAKDASVDAHPRWEFVAPALDAELTRLGQALPAAARGGSLEPAAALALHTGASLLGHCAGVLLNDAVRATSLPETFRQRAAGSLLDALLPARPGEASRRTPGEGHTSRIALGTYTDWQAWRARLARSHTAPAFDLAFRLEAPARDDGPWALAFLAVSRVDPSLVLPFADFWGQASRERARSAQAFGPDLARQALLLLGQAARMVPLLWRGLAGDEPAGLTLSLDEAHAFLKGDAWLLEDAGFRVIVPAWWTPAGRKRLQARLVPAGPAAKSAGKAAGGAALGLDGMLAFRYELALGGEPVSEAEWRRLVAAKAPLVRFRGEWVALDPAQMARVRALVDAADGQPQALTPLALMRAAAEAETGDLALGTDFQAIAQRLEDPRTLALIAPPAGLAATLRPYQARGLAWLAFLDALGLNGILADDMGLGKTVQVIARLLHEREAEPDAPPTLLIAPTSVLGNWERELARFAPALRVRIHHGGDRADDAKAFAKDARAHDVLITSYALARRDEALLAGVAWRRLVLDEAQQIKNPHAAQTRAIRRLKATHRLALTGTPVENRLLDLWSLFEFLNPGYLGKEASFRKTFETPIQRDRDAVQAERLRRLTQPFVLRRVKTDPTIIQDLPDKVEQRLYTPLTPEQASLYEAVVNEAAEAVEAASGIQRKGLVLATLMKLKQVCNHPAQLLQDGSAFDPSRSHKLARLTDHAREIVAGGESLLVFTQFAELGGWLQAHLRRALDAPVHFLHGGTSRPARERMIEAFQAADGPPSVFVLSLKAGGVGITLTRANHVFHFDRWWNPAVEDQATDRAFRIGQTRNVFVHKFVTTGTLEERIDTMLEDKRRIAGLAVGADESWLAGLDNRAFRELIALDRAAVRE